MSGWAWSMIAGFAAAAIINRDNRRALCWAIALGVTFVVGVLWFDCGLPYHAAFAGFCDLAVALAIYAFGRMQWEVTLFHIFQFSLLVNILAHFGILADPALHGAILEACNWAALIVISGTRILEAVNGLWRFDRKPPSWIHRLNHLVLGRRKTHPWWKTHRGEM